MKKVQLVDLKSEIEQSSPDLGPFKNEEFIKQSDMVKKEIDRVQKKTIVLLNSEEISLTGKKTKSLICLPPKNRNTSRRRQGRSSFSPS